MTALASYIPIVDLILLGIGYAFSQFIVMRSGTFSIATAGIAAIGAYGAAILVVRYSWGLVAALAASTLLGMLVGLLLSLPLARLRGIYQAIASLAFVQVVASLNLYFDGLTGGPLGFNKIPPLVDTYVLFLSVVVVAYPLWSLGRSTLGSVFDAMRQDAAVASSLGVNPARYSALAFTMSGAVAGLFGGLDALHNYSLTPEQFGFSFTILALSYVILGGRRTIYGPIVGAIILVILPELSRPLAEQRTAIYGLLLVFAMIYFPYGVVDTALFYFRAKKQGQIAAEATEA